MRQKGERIELDSSYGELRDPVWTVPNETPGVIVGETGRYYMIQFEGFSVVHMVPQHWVTNARSDFELLDGWTR